MPHTHDSLKSADGLTLSTSTWLPDASAKAAVVIVHGVAEHIHRYEHVANYLNTRGYAVYAMDHRGHGNSEGERTYFANFEQPVNDLRLWMERVKAANSKIFMYGHSMGSLISLLYALRYQSELAGLVSSGTPLDAETTLSPFVIMLGKALNMIVPKLHFLPLDSTTLSRDPAVSSGYDNDPLVDRKPLRLAMGVGIGSNATKVKARLSELKLPLLILHGSDDVICPPSGSDVLYQRAGSADKTLKKYDGLRHEIHNEPEQNQVLQEIADWLDKH
jgi:alpha-beta hydrolase superfamily lysophospholipase